MILSMSGQAASFLAACAAGAVLGNFYDWFRILRRLLRHKTASTNIEDAIFWVVSTLFMFVFVLQQSLGELRGFTFLGAVLGGVLYFLILSRFFTKFALAALCWLRRVILTAAKLIAAPFRALFGLLRPPAAKFKKRLNYGKRYVKIRGKGAYQRLKAGVRHAKKPSRKN